MASTEAELEAKEEAAWKRKQERWSLLRTTTPARTTYRKVGASQASLLSTPSSPLCPLCERPLVMVTSVLGEVFEGFRKVPKEVEELQVDDLLYTYDEEVIVTRSIPVLVKVRVCKDCVGHLAKVIIEKPFEEATTKINMGRGRMKESSPAFIETKSCTDGLDMVNRSRYRGGRRRM